MRRMSLGEIHTLLRQQPAGTILVYNFGVWVKAENQAWDATLSGRVYMTYDLARMLNDFAEGDPWWLS